jgi:hypothetical protein
LFTEIGFPFLVWNRKMRWLMITLAVMLHTGIAIVMGLRTFSLLMYTMLLAFVPDETVDRIRSRLAEWVASKWPGAKMTEDTSASALVRSLAPRNQLKVSS